jgi:hypothetical protein
MAGPRAIISAALGLVTYTLATNNASVASGAAGAAGVAGAAAADALDLSFDCTTSSPLAPFWASVGYTPATYALRADELENTLLISGVPNRGVAQVRIHYLLDLVTVLGFAPSAATPSGWALDYDFSGLDFALDFLVGNDLMPGFEVMGSPRGFPSLPDSFWQPFNGNGHIQPAQTLAMFRQLVADVAARCVARYGAPQVAQWHWERRVAHAQRRPPPRPLLTPRSPSRTPAAGTSRTRAGAGPRCSTTRLTRRSRRSCPTGTR